jgi:hypothetical protein
MTLELTRLSQITGNPWYFERVGYLTSWSLCDAALTCFWLAGTTRNRSDPDSHRSQIQVSTSPSWYVRRHGTDAPDGSFRIILVRRHG